MSYSVQVDIHCDECGEWINGPVSHMKPLLAKARAMARDLGWKYEWQTRTHKCPACVKREIEEAKQ